MLKKSDWREDRKWMFNILNLSHFTLCNLRCRYCYLTNSNSHSSAGAPYDIYPILQMMCLEKLLSPNGRVYWGGGEPTMLKSFGKNQELLAGYVKTAAVASNATMFSDTAFSMLSSMPGFSMTVSLDAGIRETYKIVRGRDMFEKAVRNLKKYNAASGDLTIKYVITDCSCSKEDAAGFAKICSRVEPRNVTISLDLYLDTDGEAQRRMRYDLEQELSKAGVKFWTINKGVTGFERGSA